jgi:hypothetical protein
VGLCRKVRARARIYVRGYVERLLLRELLGAVDGHERVNEGSGGDDVRHTGADVV